MLDKSLFSKRIALLTDCICSERELFKLKGYDDHLNENNRYK